MRLSKLFGKTLREVPSEADTASHQLLLRTGMITQVATGVYAYLPLAWRVLRKIEQIIREEMDAGGGQELSMPTLQPYEIWEKSGRARAFGKGLFTLKDRRERTLALGPTHEEVITMLAAINVRSYRDLPALPYQIQTKFRDEPRPRGGLLRVREFTMMDGYSFDADEAGLDATYRRMVQAYKNIYRRCGLPTIMVQADSGAIGGKDSHEFILLTDTGEDEVIFCKACEYAANVEKAEFAKPAGDQEAALSPEEVSTPGIKTIEELSAFLGLPRHKTLKCVFYAADNEPVLVAIRGDLDVNEVKLKNALKCDQLALASGELVKSAGIVAGYASPLGQTGVKAIGDDSILSGHNFVAGANKSDFHIKNVNYGRDFKIDRIADIAQARAGSRCIKCGQPLFSARGIEVGHVFKLGVAFSERFDARFLDKEGNQKPAIMGCYGIGVGRMMGAAVEQNHDDKGIVWPLPIAPYQVYLCALGMDSPEIAGKADELYEKMRSEGIEVLYDDRQESPGVKFNDADLLGIPLRVTISKRTLKTESLELKWRSQKESRLVPLSTAIPEVKSTLVSGAPAL